MKERRQRIFSLFLALVLVFTASPLHIRAASGGLKLSLTQDPTDNYKVQARFAPTNYTIEQDNLELVIKGRDGEAQEDILLTDARLKLKKDLEEKPMLVEGDKVSLDTSGLKGSQIDYIELTIDKNSVIRQVIVGHLSDGVKNLESNEENVWEFFPEDNFTWVNIHKLLWNKIKENELEGYDPSMELEFENKYEIDGMYFEFYGIILDENNQVQFDGNYYGLAEFKELAKTFSTNRVDFEKMINENKSSINFLFGGYKDRRGEEAGSNYPEDSLVFNEIDLDDGLYLIVENFEKSIPQNISDKDKGELQEYRAMPMVLSLPIEDEDGYPYDLVHLYPKNELVEPGVEKTIVEVEDTEISGPNASANLGDRIKWEIKANVPQGAKYKKFAIMDLASSGITIDEDKIGDIVIKSNGKEVKDHNKSVNENILKFLDSDKLKGLEGYDIEQIKRDIRKDIYSLNLSSDLKLIIKDLIFEGTEVEIIGLDIKVKEPNLRQIYKDMLAFDPETNNSIDGFNQISSSYQITDKDIQNHSLKYVEEKNNLDELRELEKLLLKDENLSPAGSRLQEIKNNIREHKEDISLAALNGAIGGNNKDAIEISKQVLKAEKKNKALTVKNDFYKSIEIEKINEDIEIEKLIKGTDYKVLILDNKLQLAKERLAYLEQLKAGDKDSMAGRLSELENKISETQTAITALEAEIVALENANTNTDIGKLNKKKVELEKLRISLKALEEERDSLKADLNLLENGLEEAIEKEKENIVGHKADLEAKKGEFPDLNIDKLLEKFKDEYKEGTLVIFSFTETGLKKIEDRARLEDVILSVEIEGHINDKALIEGSAPNKAGLQYSNNKDDEKEVEEEETPIVYVGGYNWLKVDYEDHNHRLEDAKFIIKRKSDGKFVQLVDVTASGDKKIEEVKGRWTVEKLREDKILTGKLEVRLVSAKDEASKFVSDDKGYISLNGVEFDEYYLIETDAPDGYAQIKGEIGFSENSGFEVNKTSYYDTPNSSSYIENKSRNIPETGGIGSLIFIVAGLCLVIGGVYVLKKRKQNLA